MEVSIFSVDSISAPLDQPTYRSLFQIKQFKDAIEDDFFFEMLIDDLPVWGYIGEVSVENL